MNASPSEAHYLQYQSRASSPYPRALELRLDHFDFIGSFSLGFSMRMRSSLHAAVKDPMMVLVCSHDEHGNGGMLN